MKKITFESARVPRERVHRAKKKESGEWVEGYYVHYRDMIHHIHCLDPEGKPGDKCSLTVEIDPSTLCEYTGLRVKNGGKESERIFEGDILKVSCSAFDSSKPVEFYTVEYVRGMFLARCVSSGKLVGPVSNLAATVSTGVCEDTSCKIIGNMFDDATLLDKLRP